MNWARQFRRRVARAAELDPLHHLAKTRGTERLEQIVRRVGLKGPDRVSIVSGHENGNRHVRAAQRFNNAKSVNARHLRIEEDDVGLLFLDQGDGRHPVLGLEDPADISVLVEQADETFACSLLIIDHEGPDWSTRCPLSIRPLSRNTCRHRRPPGIQRLFLEVPR
jgi:hypothetical protein